MDIETIEDFSDVEEGEILDDSFDAISDDSFIFLQNKGKLDTRESDLRALSLSSISDEEESPRKHHSRRRKSQQRHKRKRLLRNGVSSSSDSDSDEMVSLNKNLLKEAIRLDHAEELHKNSLSTRLKGMISDSPRKNAKSDLKTISSPTNSAPEQIIIDSDSSDETELIQLRLEALKTAVLNKVTVRKRRKLLEENNASKNEQTPSEQNVETNKENNKAEDTNIIKLSEESSKKEATSDNEDEDVLRAILLASISQKITKKTTSEVPLLKNSVHSAKNVFSSGYIPPSSTKNATSSQSELFTEKNALPSGKNALPSSKNALPSNKNALLSKINAFPHKNTVLPSQNAQNSKKTLHNAKTIHNLSLKQPSVVAPPKINVKPLIINFTSDTDSDDDTKATKQVTKKPNVDNSLKIFLRQNKTKSTASNVLNNQEKQNEGLQLTIDKFLKQQRAQVEATQPKTPISKKTHPQEVNDLVFKSAVKLLPKNKQIEYQKLMERLKNAEKSKTTKNGSISIAKRVRRLSQKIGGEEKKVDLAKKKLELSALHRTLKDVQCLENGRLQIKEKYNELTPLMKKINEATNDRKKQEIRIKTLFSQLAEARTNLTKSHDVFSNLVNEFIAKKQSIDVSDIKAAETTKVPETKVVENSLQNIVDPNDIVFKKKENNAAPVSNYVSPLDFTDRKSAPMVDPLGILCPYEINGLCKDSDCNFNHYLKT